MGRLTKASCGRAAYLDHLTRAGTFFKGESVFAAAANSFLNIPANNLPLLFNDLGLHMSYNRLGFAIQNMETMHLTPLTRATEINRIIDRFGICYWQIVPGRAVKSSVVSSRLEAIRNARVRHWAHALPLTAEYDRPPNLVSKYHYDFTTMIQSPNGLGINEFEAFKRLNKEIMDDLENMPLD